MDYRWLSPDIWVTGIPADPNNKVHSTVVLGLNFEVFSCRVPLDPPKIKKRLKNGLTANLKLYS